MILNSILSIAALCLFDILKRRRMLTWRDLIENMTIVYMLEAAVQLVPVRSLYLDLVEAIDPFLVSMSGELATTIKSKAYEWGSMFMEIFRLVWIEIAENTRWLFEPPQQDFAYKHSNAPHPKPSHSYGS